MKRIITLILLITGCFQTLSAQRELPQKFGIVIGGGLAIPAVEANENDYFNLNGNRVGYNLTAETRIYCSPNIAIGARYDYINSQKAEDKMHVNFIAPEFVVRVNNERNTEGFLLSLAPGYLSYEERVHYRNNNGHTFQKGYFGLDITLGYEFTITNVTHGILKFSFLTADWGINPDARLMNPNPDYDDGIDHSWFKSKIMFFNLGFALQFGK